MVGFGGISGSVGAEQASKNKNIEKPAESNVSNLIHGIVMRAEKLHVHVVRLDHIIAAVAGPQPVDPSGQGPTAGMKSEGMIETLRALDHRLSSLHMMFVDRLSALGRELGVPEQAPIGRGEVNIHTR